ncbi:uncharacterized protein LOC135823664 [Sycon ciliatum]|uniref:uncharacterized protein LOC135823664 n=1 Tax=Sycon ciliatum TaxID=27933 RepID=UPI0031F6685B
MPPKGKKAKTRAAKCLLSDDDEPLPPPQVLHARQVTTISNEQLYSIYKTADAVLDDDDVSLQQLSLFISELSVAIDSFLAACSTFDNACMKYGFLDLNESGLKDRLQLGLVSRGKLRCLESKRDNMQRPSQSTATSSTATSRSPSSSNVSNPAVPDSAHGSSYASIRLPKLTLPKFDGNFSKFREFHEIFQASVGASKLSDVEKFAYLQENVEGVAKEAIAGFDLTGANYRIAMDVLEERFGDVQIHIDSHYTAMTHLPPATDKPASLRKLLDEIERNLRSLEALKQDVEHPLFIPMITAKLPQAVMVQLELARGSDSWTVASLRKALGILVRVKETSERQCHDANKGHQQHPAPSHVISTGVSLLPHHEKRRPPKCFYCSGAHFSDECGQYRDLDARKAHSKLNDRCSICFRSDHIARDCKQARPCFHCKLSTHHRSLCGKKFGGASVAQSEQKPENSTTLNVDATPFLSATQTLTSTCEHVIMQTALATIQDESGQSLQARLLFDTGSSRTYIKESTRKALHIPTIGTDVTAMANFGASQRTTQNLPQVEFNVQLLDGSAQSVQASVVPQICCPILKTPLDTQTHPSLERLPLAEPLTLTREHVEIDILVGTDFYYDFVLTDRTHFPDGLILLDTKLGFICTGKVPHSEIQPDESTVMVHDVPDPQCTRSDFLDKPPSELHGSPSSFLGEDPVRLTTPTPDEFEECVAE